MNRPLRIAIVGSGIGRSHAEAYRALPEQFEVLAMCDLNVDRAREAAEAHNIPLVTASLDELCAMEEVDVIDLCTPPHLHFEQIVRGLAAGKHVICEKPLVDSLKAADELIAAEAASGRRVMPIFQYRFGHGLQKLKHLVDRGLAGKAYLSTVEVAWRRGAAYYAVPWRGKWRTEGGGTLFSHAVHTIDMLTLIAGPVRRVFAHTATRVNPIEVEDCAAISLEMADGSLATVAVTLGSAVEITRHRFCFSELTAESNLKPYHNSHEPWQFTPMSDEAAARIDAALAEFVPLPERFVGQFYRFAEAMRGGGELPVTLADARASLEILTALYTSSQTGQPVSLPIGREHPAYAGWVPAEYAGQGEG
jgi:predicted dehydrogenase